MKFPIRLDPRLATVLAVSLAFVAAASIVFIQLLSFTPGGMDLARLMWAIPLLGMAAVGALTWWIIFPKWMEGRRVQKLVRDVTGVGEAEIVQERANDWQKSRRMRWGWFLGMGGSVVMVLLLHSSTADAPLWIPLSIVTVLAQMNMRQAVEERVRTLVVCGLLVFIFGGAGRNLLTTLQGSVVLVTSLFAMVGWHFWQMQRGLAEMQTLVREARYDQAIAKADLSPSSFAPALKAYALFRQGDTEKAKFGLRVALAKSEDASKASFALAKYGELLLAEGQIEESLAPVQAALKLRPDETRAHRVMAQIYLEQNDHLRRGFSRRQKDSDRQSKLLAYAKESAAAESGQNKDLFVACALRHARRAAELAPQRGAELAVFAWALAAAGNAEEAQDTVQKASQAITDQLDVAEGRYFLARAYAVMGELDKSRSSYEAVRGAEAHGHYRNLAETGLREIAAQQAGPDTSTAALQSLSAETAKTPGTDERVRR